MKRKTANIDIRVEPQLIEKIDSWRARQRVPPSRAAAISYMLEHFSSMIGRNYPAPLYPRSTVMFKNTILGAVSAVALLSGVAAQADEANSYAQGHEDWQTYKPWFDAQTGDRGAGVKYWAANRNVPGHMSCDEAASDYKRFGDKLTFMVGCQEAARRLDPIDARRHSDPEYRLGFADAAKGLSPQANAPVTSVPTSSSATSIEHRVTADERPALRAVVAIAPIQSEPAHVREESSSAPMQITPVVVTPTIATAPAAAPVATITMPSGEQVEQHFIKVVQDGLTEFSAPGANEMAQGAARVHRAQAICRTLNNLSITRWVGTVSTLSSNNDGRGVLVISIAPNVQVRTWNNALSDSFDHTLIDPSSAVYSQAVELKEGRQVRFSGSFLKDQKDCVREASLTQSGSMESPEFVFRFATLDPL